MQFFLSNLCYFKKQNNKKNKFEQNLIKFFQRHKANYLLL